MSTASKEPDYSALQAALAAERQRRVALEARLAELESSLATMRGGAEKAADDLAAFSLQHALAADAPTDEERAALDLWMLESELRIEDRERAERIVAAPLPILVEQTPRALSDKLAETKLAMEAAEQRAQHNAQQVKRLTEELMAARAEQIRTASRMRDLEDRLTRTEQYGVGAAPPVADWPRPDHSLPLPLDETAAPTSETFAQPSIEDEMLQVAFQLRAPVDAPAVEQPPQSREARRLPVFEEFELPGAPIADHAPRTAEPELSCLDEARGIAPAAEEPAEPVEARGEENEAGIVETSVGAPPLEQETEKADLQATAAETDTGCLLSEVSAADSPTLTPSLNLEDALALWSTDNDLPVSGAPEAAQPHTAHVQSPVEKNETLASPGLSLEEALAEFSATASAPTKAPTPAPEDTAVWQPLIDEAPEMEDSFITPSLAGLPGDWQDAAGTPEASITTQAPPVIEPPRVSAVEPLETPASPGMTEESAPPEPETPDLKSGEIFEIEVIDEHTPLPPVQDAEEEPEIEASSNPSIGIEDLEAAPLPAPESPAATLATEAAPAVPSSELLEPVPDFEAEQGVIEEETHETPEARVTMADAQPSVPDQKAYLKPLPEFVSELESDNASRQPVSLSDLASAERERASVAAQAAEAKPAARTQTPIAASARDGAGVMAESLRAWGGIQQPSAARKAQRSDDATRPIKPALQDDADEESAASETPKGRKGMVEALMRFMGPR